MILILENKPFSNVTYKECRTEPIINLCRNMTPSVQSTRRLIASPSLKSNFGPAVTIRQSPVMKQRTISFLEDNNLKKKESLGLLQSFSKIPTKSSKFYQESNKDPINSMNNYDSKQVAFSSKFSKKITESINEEQYAENKDTVIKSSESIDLSESINHIMKNTTNDGILNYSKPKSNLISTPSPEVKTSSNLYRDVMSKQSDEISIGTNEHVVIKEIPTNRKPICNFKYFRNIIEIEKKDKESCEKTESKDSKDMFDYEIENEFSIDEEIKIIPAFNIKKCDTNFGKSKYKKMQEDLMKYSLKNTPT